MGYDKQRAIKFFAICVTLAFLISATVSLIKVIQITSRVVNDYCGLGMI